MHQHSTVGADGPSSTGGRSEQKNYLFEYRRQIRGLLAMIRAIVRRTAQSGQSPEEYAALLEGRVGALARAQDMLMRVPEAGADLMEIVSAEFLAQGVPEDRLDVQGASVPLPGRIASSLALAVHELTTNAIRFGALSAPQGRLSVSWKETDQGLLHLEWRETGVPVISSQPRRNGFGLELLEKMLPYELRARTCLQFAPGGLVCTIEFPSGKAWSEPS